MGRLHPHIGERGHNRGHDGAVDSGFVRTCKHPANKEELAQHGVGLIDGDHGTRRCAPGRRQFFPVEQAETRKRVAHIDRERVS